MQNVSYPTRELALGSPCAPFELAACARCAFMFNAAFDSALMSYDVAYDNHVESAAFQSYYEALARMLIERFGLDEGGVVYDVGCGRGTFLKTLCSLAPAVHGIGIDPSCEPLESGNVTLLRSTFERALVKGDAKLILLRHVLEHIDEPLEFMRELRASAGTVPLFVEVPEATWIFENGAFWDFCYEHCNYFVPESLATTLSLAGFRVEEQQASFGGQYQWVLCRGDDAVAAVDFPRGATAVEKARAYGERELGLLKQAIVSLADAAGRGQCAIWGMATKGVVFASMLPSGLVAGGVDSNVRKQGRYAPGSGLGIHPPPWLATLTGRVTAMVMNPNYFGEIEAQVRSLGLDVDLRVV